MPTEPKPLCRYPGCNNRRPNGRRFCEQHQAQDDSAYNRRRGSAAKRGYDRKWRKTRARIIARDPICRAPGCIHPSTDVDHIVPKALGGSDDDDNLQGLCKTCHSRKTAREDGRWGS